MSQPQTKTNYTVKRVALMLHVSPQYIVDAIEKGKLHAIRETGGSYLIPDSSMREFMKDGNPFVVKKNR